MASNETATTESGLRPARRTIVKGAAWAVPAIAVAAPAHAAGASQCITWSFGEGSYKCPGQSTEFAFGYGLKFCAINTCEPGAACQNFVIRLDMPVLSNSGATLVKMANYDNPELNLCPGESDCVDMVYQFGSDDSAGKILFWVEVNGGDPVQVEVFAPPRGCPETALTVEEPAVEEPAPGADTESTTASPQG